MKSKNPITSARVNLSLMLALTFSTGIIDAVGYLGLDRVFTGNMTGNVVLLGMALTGTTTLPILRPILALALFCVGAIVAGRALRKHEGDWSGLITTLLGFVSLGLALVAIMVLAVDYHTYEIYGSIATSMLGFVMGMQAALARVVKVADVTTVVVTSTITGLAADSRLAGGTGAFWPRRVLAILLIMAGAAVGAVALLIHIAVGLGIAALITFAVAIIGHRSHLGAGSPR